MLAGRQPGLGRSVAIYSPYNSRGEVLRSRVDVTQVRAVKETGRHPGVRRPRLRPPALRQFLEGGVGRGRAPAQPVASNALASKGHAVQGTSFASSGHGSLGLIVLTIKLVTFTEPSVSFPHRLQNTTLRMREKLTESLMWLRCVICAAHGRAYSRVQYLPVPLAFNAGR